MACPQITNIDVPRALNHVISIIKNKISSGTTLGTIVTHLLTF